MIKNYSIQLFRLIASVMVIAIHTAPFSEISKYLALGINQIFSRIAVPFFFCLAGYFYIKNMEKKDYLKNYIIKILKIYVVWGLIYFPYSFLYQAVKSERSLIISIIEYIRNIIIGGAHFHLWYFPALIFGVILFDCLYKKIEMRKIIILAIFLYMIGLLGLSYYGILSGLSQKIMDIYFKIFIRTRNGLFFGFPFVVMGAQLARMDISKYSQNRILVKIFVFYIFMNVEAFYLWKMNISKYTDAFILLPFIVFYIMIFLINDSIKNFSEKILKITSYEDYSLGIYLVHGVYLIIFENILEKFGLEIYKTIYFVLVLTSSIISIWSLKKVIKRNKFKILRNYI